MHAQQVNGAWVAKATLTLSLLPYCIHSFDDLQKILGHPQFVVAGQYYEYSCQVCVTCFYC